MALDDTIILEEKADDTTGVRVILTDSIQNDNTAETKILEVTNKVVIIDSESQTNYIGFKSHLNTFKLINMSKFEVIFSFENVNIGMNKIIQDTVLNQFALKPYSAIDF